MTLLPRGPLVFDTGIYIRYYHGQNYGWLGEDARICACTYLTAVVAAELYAGTRSHPEKRALDRLSKAHQGLGHFSSPPAATWIQAGALLARASRTAGQIDFAHHFRDLLIALEAVRLGATLVTENARDFVRWQRLIQISGSQKLMLFDPSEGEPEANHE
jgi:predicted nucleic acid-binding protein